MILPMALCLLGNEMQVNISEECREKVLATDVTAYDIFDDARAEVLAVMEVSCFIRRGKVSLGGVVLEKYVRSIWSIYSISCLRQPPRLRLGCPPLPTDELQRRFLVDGRLSPHRGRHRRGATRDWPTESRRFVARLALGHTCREIHLASRRQQ